MLSTTSPATLVANNGQSLDQVRFVRASYPTYIRLSFGGHTMVVERSSVSKSKPGATCATAGHRHLPLERLR